MSDRTVTRSAAQSSEKPLEADLSKSSAEPTTEPAGYVPTPIVKKVEAKKSKKTEEDSESELEEGEEEGDDEVMEEDFDEDEDEEEEYVPTPITRRTSGRRSANKAEDSEPKVAAKKATPKKEKDVKAEEAKRMAKELKKIEKEKKKEKKRREKERRIRESELDAELRAAHGGVTKKKKKVPEAIVGGLPTYALHNDPVVANPYNYDPRTEMMKLGTGQLKSAYRKTKNNVELHIEKNLYKLEPKRGSGEEEGEPEHREPEHHEPEHQEPEHHEPFKSAEERHPWMSDSRQKKPVFDYSGEEPAKEFVAPPPKKSKPTTPVYTPKMSRQDKMIAEGGTSSSSAAPIGSLSSFRSTPRRTSFIPEVSSVSRHTSSELLAEPTNAPWMPNVAAVDRRHSMLDDELSGNAGKSPTSGPSSPFGTTSASQHQGEKPETFLGHVLDSEGKIPAHVAMARLKVLVAQLDALNAE